MSIKMKIIPEPKRNTRSVLAPAFVGPAIQGSGAVNYDCGACGSTLLQNMEYKQVHNLVIKCRNCGEHNEIPLSHNTH